MKTADDCINILVQSALRFFNDVDDASVTAAVAKDQALFCLKYHTLLVGEVVYFKTSVFQPVHMGFPTLLFQIWRGVRQDPYAGRRLCVSQAGRRATRCSRYEAESICVLPQNPSWDPDVFSCSRLLRITVFCCRFLQIDLCMSILCEKTGKPACMVVVSVG